MADKKVKVSNILSSIIPDYVVSESPLFKEFLEQYYHFDGHEYGIGDLAENINEYKSISKLSEIETVRAQTVTPTGAATPPQIVILTQRALAFDDVINVNHTKGFPDAYGLLKIGDEIITYTGKTATSFTGCARGFSGIDKLETPGNPENLVFSETEANPHDALSPVLNLSFVYLGQFYNKFKTHFLPGVEKRQFASGLAIENILTRAKDFYAAKGTDTSLDILFKVLFGKPVTINKPFNSTIVASDAEWNKGDQVMVEAIEGNPMNLKFSSLYQGDLDTFSVLTKENSTASGAISNVEEVFLENKTYHRISLSRETIDRGIDPLFENRFTINNKTKVIGTNDTIDTVSVDSTVGFGATGYFWYPNTSGTYKQVSYSSKSYNQFFGCVGLTTSIPQDTAVISSNFVYGYEDNDTSKVCKMRISGGISGISTGFESTKFLNVGDTISARYVGEKTDVLERKFNTWTYNSPIEYDVLLKDVVTGVSGIQTGAGSGGSITLLDIPAIKKGHFIDVYERETGAFLGNNMPVSEVTANIVKYTNELNVNNVADAGKNYSIRDNIRFISPRLGLGNVLADIQNSFIDSKGNAYVAFSGYPSSDFDTTDRSKTFTSKNVVGSGISIADHEFLNGEKVYYQPSTDDSGIVGLDTGIYYVQRIDDDNIRLSLSRQSIFSNDTLWDLKTAAGLSTHPYWNQLHVSSGLDEHKIMPHSLYRGGSLKNQNNFKKIPIKPAIANQHDDIIGAVGVTLNGLELHSTISQDSVHYGQIDKINVLTGGSDYDVINPPNVSVGDSEGSAIDCNVHLNDGKVSEIVVTESGWDYYAPPAVSITGGNGVGAECQARLQAFTHSVAVGEASVGTATTIGKITLPTGETHRFLDGEEVVYTTTGSAVGIASTNAQLNYNAAGVGATTFLIDGTTYFVAKTDDTEFSLAITRERALNKEFLINFLDDGSGTHTFTAKRKRKKISEIVVKTSGSNFGYNKVEIDSQKYPPENRSGILTTFVGINTHDDYIYARNHNFASGDVVSYSNGGTVITGLSTSTQYTITVIDSDKFKLSDSNTNYRNKTYVNMSTIGVGTHTFNYPEIKVNIDGVTAVGVGSTVLPSYSAAKALPIIKGKVDNVFIRKGGVGYGVTNIVNHIRQPKIDLFTGKGAIIGVSIGFGGKVDSVNVIDGGSEYTTPPVLEVVGAGKLAKLKANIVDGKIDSVTVITPGKNYIQGETIIRIVPAGLGALFNCNIHEWRINNVKRYEHVINDSTYNAVQLRSTKGNKLASFFVPKKIREDIDDNLKSNGEEKPVDQRQHSKIIGWAYDGNPIYAPYGKDFSANEIRPMRSSYISNPVSDTGIRPNYPTDYFIEDFYFSKGSGDLDEFNGRWEFNDDYPDGIYCYYSTINDSTSSSPKFPYLPFKHQNESDKFNYDTLIDQSDEYINTGEYKRSITHLGFDNPTTKYKFVSNQLASNPLLKIDSIRTSGITTVFVDDPGNSYKVGDTLTFTNSGAVSGTIDKIFGKNIVSIATSAITSDNLKFSIKGKTVTAFSTLPHNYIDGDSAEIVGVSSAFYSYIEGNRTVGVNTTTTIVSVAIAATSVTGVATFISLSEPTNTDRFRVGDIIEMQSEQMLILNKDDYNNRYRVARLHNGTSGTTHAVGVDVIKKPLEFTFQVDKTTQNKNIEEVKKFNFDGQRSVGIGSTAVDVIVGYAGSFTQSKTVPARAIYAPNHPFVTGQELSYVAVGSTLKGTREYGGAEMDFKDFSKLYCVKLNDEFIGITTEKTGVSQELGFTTSRVYFSTVNGSDHRFESIPENITGKSIKREGRLILDSIHSLELNDIISLNVTSNRTDAITFKYNDDIKKLTSNEKQFVSTAVTTTTHEITIEDHKLKTGDIIVYSSSNVATPLVNNGIYYAVRISDDVIRLAENAYNANKPAYEGIKFTTQGSGTHTIASVNPPLSFYRGSIVTLDVSDSSLTNYDINLYNDKNFISKYDSSSVTREGAFGDGSSGKLILDIDESFPDNIYYQVEGVGSNYVNTYESATNTEVRNYSNINVVESLFNKDHKVSAGIGTTTFAITLVGAAETTSYSSSGFSSAFYTTNSKTEKGGVHSVRINNVVDTNTLSRIISIGTTVGSDAVFSEESNEIGQINGVQISDQGLEFTNDKTLTPKADPFVVLKLRDVYTLDSIGVTTGGNNYTSPPVTVAIGNTIIKTDTHLVGNSVSSVDVIQNDTGISENIKIIPTINSNGVAAIGATCDQFQTNEIRIREPIAGFTSENFPFSVGDRIFVENIDITDDADGYNSSDYDYQYFTITGINTLGGNASVKYSISGIGSTAGNYDNTSEFGRVIKAVDLAGYEANIKKVQFLEGEKISSSDGLTYGYVAKDGWNKDSQTLKLKNVVGKFKEKDKIESSLRSSKSIIQNVYDFNFDLEVDSLVSKATNWQTDKGKLSHNDQRLHDNDYYQRFSYAIKGEIPYDTWKEPITSLGHISGYKPFADLEIIPTTSDVGMSTFAGDIALKIEIDSDASVWCRYYYDMGLEDPDTTTNTLSKIITFNGKVLTDYNESRTNKVLLLKDISDQFTGFTTTTGGQVVGLTTFALYTIDTPGQPNTGVSTERLFYKTIQPSVGIDTSTGVITINDHEFNTGEELDYTADTTAIKVDNGGGGQVSLGSKVYAIKESKNTFKIASSKANANAGTAHTITNIVGVGNTHTFAVPPELATNRVMISIDNIIQSPLAFVRNLSVGLQTSAGIGTQTLFLDDTAKIKGNSLLKIENEIVKVDLVGIGTTPGDATVSLGSTQALSVTRGVMGTVAAAHTTGAGVTVLSGDYRIQDGSIHFIDAPYGYNAGIGSTSIFSIKSSFDGRSFYRLKYDNNFIFDDISESFDSEEDEFMLYSNNVDMLTLTADAGITTNYGFVLVNNIFQDPHHGEGGSSLNKSDYTIAGAGNSITFAGTYVPTGKIAAATQDLPQGGIINEFDVNPGSGIQSSFRATATCVIGVGGTIASVSIGNSGTGYLEAPSVSVATTESHYEHRFVSAGTNSVTDNGSGTHTPTYATYDSTTGNLVLTIPDHGLTTSNTVAIANDTLEFQCSRDNYTSNKTYPRSTDPVSGIQTAITAKTDDTITVNVGAGAGIGASVTATISNGMVSGLTIANAGTGYTSTDMPTIIIDAPSPWKNVPLIGGNGSGATVDLTVGVAGSAISYNLNDPGVGYSVNDVLHIDPPYTPGISTSRFSLTVKNRHQDKFSGWTVGQLLELDDFSSLFNGFRKSFLITRTIVNKEYYSIRAMQDSGIVLANNLFIFINDVLQQPNQDYEFNGGTRIKFIEAPKPGSKLRVYLYVASTEDYLSVDVDQTVKEGDGLTLQEWRTDDISKIPSWTTAQDERKIYELLSSDSVQTQVYGGVGIRTDGFERPIKWCKQTSDMVIDGVYISKSRVSWAPQLTPTTNIIKDVSSTDNKIYVKNTYPTFSHTDDLAQNLNDIRIISQDVTRPAFATASVSLSGTISTITITDGGFGYTSAPQVSIQPMPEQGYGVGTTATGTANITAGIVTSITLTNAGVAYSSANPPVVLIEPEGSVEEKIEKVTYDGDYGLVIGIQTATITNAGVTTHQIIYDLIPHPNIVAAKTKSGLATGDYFVIDNTSLGSPSIGVTAVGVNTATTVGIGTQFLNSVYQVYHHEYQPTGTGSSTVRVTCNVQDHQVGITTAGLESVIPGATGHKNAGTYTWGVINVNRNANSKSFNAYTQNGVGNLNDSNYQIGISTSAYVSRLLGLREST